MESLDKQFKKENSRDFQEITLALALLGGLLAFLFKLINYFNENIILWNESTQIKAYFFLGALLLEFLIIFLFFILKGISLSTNKRREYLEDIIARLFKFGFIFPLIWFVDSFLLVLFYYIIKNINFDISAVIIFLILIIDFILFVNLWGKEELNKDLDLVNLKIKSTKLKPLIVYIIILFIILIIFYPAYLKLYSEAFLVAPSILLMGSFSIEDFPQSNENCDILTLTIKETGLTFSRNFIYLYKLNAANNSLNESDNITLPIQLESKNKSMFGGLHDKGVWYININTSNLQAGNYMLHAEVTNDLSINSTFGVFKKHADKLFYIASNSGK